MPFSQLSANSNIDYKDMKKHISSFINHTLAMFMMMRVSKESKMLCKKILNTMPVEIADTILAKQFWMNNRNKNIKLHMRSPAFLQRIPRFTDTETRDSFICE